MNGMWATFAHVCRALLCSSRSSWSSEWSALGVMPPLLPLPKRAPTKRCLHRSSRAVGSYGVGRLRPRLQVCVCFRSLFQGLLPCAHMRAVQLCRRITYSCSKVQVHAQMFEGSWVFPHELKQGVNVKGQSSVALI